MNRTRSQVMRWRIKMVGVALVATGSWGCDRTAATPDTVASGPDKLPLPVVRADTSHAAIVAQAESLYVFGRERQPVTVSDRRFKGPYVADESIPRMTIATAKLKSGITPPAHRIIARIRSARDYPKMGIDSGYNYVWRSSWDSAAAATWVTKVVPRDTSTAMHLLTRDPRNQEFTHGMSAMEPRLVRIQVHSAAIGACLDDPICPSGHCGYY
jgi:hypothetical protein